MTLTSSIPTTGAHSWGSYRWEGASGFSSGSSARREEDQGDHVLDEACLDVRRLAAKARLPWEEGQRPVTSIPSPVSQSSDPLTYFTGLADRYAANRPSYPTEAIEAILRGLPRPTRVVDVGCGTGICTTLLAAAGAEVIGIEPNDEMRDRAMADLPPSRCSGVDYRKGTAEATGLPEASVHAVVCAQSFHWFAAEATLVEFHRILVPGGRLALMWNNRVPRSEMDQVYAQVVVEAQAEAKRQGLVLRCNREADLSRWSHLFAGVRRIDFPNPQVCDLSMLLGKASSASYFPRRTEIAEALLKRLREAFERFASGGVVSLNQECRVTLADRCD